VPEIRRVVYPIVVCDIIFITCHGHPGGMMSSVPWPAESMAVGDANEKIVIYGKDHQGSAFLDELMNLLDATPALCVGRFGRDHPLRASGSGFRAPPTTVPKRAWGVLPIADC
jgi:hypothetical protein